tara:strand:+ start:1014 stop:1733 length:720 start_codon:yes stop_codon:yes gene_type:complete
MTLKQAKEKLEEIFNTYDNLNTRMTKISRLLSELKQKEKLTKIEKKIQLMYRKKLYELKIEYDERERPEFNKDNQLEKLRKDWELHVDGRDKLITGLYLFLEPLHSDYADSKYLDGYISLKLIKTNADVEKKIKVPKQLLKLCDNFYNDLPKVNNTFVQTLRRASQRVFKRNITINDYRKIWTEYGIRTMSIRKQKELAKKMNHSFATHMSEYTPRMVPVYSQNVEEELEKIIQMAERL